MMQWLSKIRDYFLSIPNQKLIFTRLKFWRMIAIAVL
jgi:hypothetical protein